MPATDIEVCNLALGFVGHKKPISSLTANTAEAEQCAIYYPHVKDLVTGRFPWAFASRDVLLALHGTATDERFTYVYVAPSDMARPNYLWNGVRPPTADDAVPFELFDKGTGVNALQVVLTDLEDARLVYTTKQLPVAVYPVHVADAIAWQLAAYLCGPLRVDPALVIGAESKAEQKFLRACAVELNKGQRDVQPRPEFMRVR